MRNGKAVASVWENNREDGEDSATQVRRHCIHVSGKVQSAPGIFIHRPLCVPSGCRAGNEERRPGVHGADLWQEALQPPAVQQLQRPHCLPRDGRLTACRCNLNGPISFLLSILIFIPQFITFIFKNTHKSS